MWWASCNQLLKETEKLQYLEKFHPVCIGFETVNSSLHLWDYSSPNCVGCTLKKFLVLLFPSRWLCLMNSNLYQNWQRSQGKAQRCGDRDWAVLKLSSMSKSLSSTSNWKNRRKWTTQREVEHPSRTLSDWV